MKAYRMKKILSTGFLIAILIVVFTSGKEKNDNGDEY